MQTAFINSILDPQKHTTPLRFFLAVNKKELKWFILNAVFYSSGTTALLLATYYLGRLVDVVTLHTGEQALTLVTLLITCLVCYEGLYRFGHMCEVYVVSRIRRNTKRALFDHTSSLSFGYFADRFAGEIAHKVATTANAFEQMSMIVTNGFIENIVLIPLSAIALGVVHPYYGGFIIAWAILFCFGSIFLAREMYQRASAYATEEAKTTGAIVDVYGNIGAVKVYGKRHDLQRAHGQIEAETKAFQRLGRWDILTFHFQGTSIVILSIGIIWITALLLGRNALSLGAIVFLSTATLRLFNVAWEMGRNLASFIHFRGESAQNLSDLVVAPVIVDGEYAAGRRKREVRVEYRRVVFSYHRVQPVLDDFSITIHPKEKVGIVGLSGAGKTTFANLLLRFFDVQKGEIFLNDVDVRNMTQEFLRSHISYISQDTSLFHASIAENIAYGSSAASRKEIERAAALAYADEFITTLPHGYASIVGERGIKLSGGQRQRIAIARALLADRPLFLLDEATSALDSESEQKIQKGLAALMEDKTVIAIAHRLSTLSRMDRVVFLENGHIVEDGTHEALLKRKGKYAALWRMQAGGFLPNITRL